MPDLRTRLIRLANENPAVRTHLLPILREAEVQVPAMARMLAKVCREFPGSDWNQDAEYPSIFVVKYRGKPVAVIGREGSRHVIRYKNAPGPVMRYPVRTILEIEEWLRAELTDWKNRPAWDASVADLPRGQAVTSSVVGKFEEGKPADPTEHMTEEQKKKWWQEHAKNKDQFAKSAADPKGEILRHMMTLFDAAERVFGREAIKGAFEGATTDAFKSGLGSKAGMPDLKKLQGLLVWPVQDAAHDQNPGRDIQVPGDDPRSNYARGDGARTLKVPRIDLTPEAAAWFGELNDSVQFSLGRAVLAAKAKQYGVVLDRAKTIYGSVIGGGYDDLMQTLSFPFRGKFTVEANRSSAIVTARTPQDAARMLTMLDIDGFNPRTEGPTRIRVDLHEPEIYTRVAADDRALVTRLTRIAAVSDALRPHLLPMLKEACGCDDAEAPVMGKFEEGKPADPTKGMSPEDKKKWELNTLKHKDKFKEASVMTRLKQRVRLKGPPEEVIPGGTLARAEFFRTKPSKALLKVEGRDQPVSISTKDLANYLDGFVHPPVRSVLREWAASGTSETPTGASAPADGWADDGSPAWTLVLKGAY